MKLAEHKDKSLVVDILSQSFDDNKSINYIVKQDSRRKQRIKNLMSYCFDICMLKGQVFLSDDRNACALILQPERKIGFLKESMLDLRFALTSAGITNALKALNREKLIKQNHPQEPFYYLWFIGTLPTAQGRGIGSELMDKIFQKYEKLPRPFYLETSVVKNVAWYKKYRFEVFKELDLGYTLYLMLKPKP